VPTGEHVRRWQRPPHWLWTASIAAQVFATLLTSSSFFFLDDYVFLNQARNDSLSIAYLRQALYEHFSPISRLLDSFVVAVAPGSWVFTHGFELAMYAGALVAFAWVMCLILGNGWRAFWFTLLFGQSVFLIRLLVWWTATANILPATVFSLISIGCYLRWREVGSRKLLLGSFVAFELALLDYETAMLLPIYIAVISLLVLERHPGPRAWVAALWRERSAWAGYVILDALAFANYYSYYYYPRKVHPSLSVVAHFLAIALFQTFIPGLTGIQYRRSPLGAHPLLLVGIVVVLAALAVTLYLRPRAWRCLVAFVIVFLVTMVPLADNRIVHYGLKDAYVLYYQQSVQFMFWILAAFAISARWSGQRKRSAVRGSRRAMPGRGSRRLLGAGGLVGVVAYTALYLTSLHVLRNVTWQAAKDRVYVSNYLASVKRIKATRGREPVLIDLRVPTIILPAGLRPYTTYGEFFALFNSHLLVGENTNPLYVVGASGRLQRVKFTTSTRGLLDQASVSTSASAHAAATPALRNGTSACAPAGEATEWLRVPLARTQFINAPLNARPAMLRVRFRTVASDLLPIELTGSGGHRLGFVSRIPRGQAGGEVIPLYYNGYLASVEFRLPAGGCVTSLAVGRLVDQP
jgi:hypothetical protein